MRAVVGILLLCLSGSSSALFWNFKPYTSQTNCLTVPGNSQNDLTTLSVAACTTSSFQKFGDTAVGSPLLTISPGTSVSCSPKCLGVVGANANGALVVQQDCNPASLTQYWVEATATGVPLAGYFWYKSFATGRCLTAETGYVDQWDCTTLATHQLWSIGEADESVGGSAFANQQLLGLTCLAVKGGSTANGAGTETATCSAGAFYQHFLIQSQYANTWTISGSNKCMDGGNTAQQTFQYTCVPSARNHQWFQFSFPSENFPGYSYYMDLLSGLCLTWDPNNLNNVRTDTCVQGNTNQQWIRTLV